ncbi:hypothetical protein JH26_24180 [Microvirga sp. BSC39]|nr:hypothetical protein JH26_24180 [Microvirga sp. BSC39]
MGALKRVNSLKQELALHPSVQQVLSDPTFKAKSDRPLPIDLIAITKEAKAECVRFNSISGWEAERSRKDYGVIPKFDPKRFDLDHDVSDFIKYQFWIATLDCKNFIDPHARYEHFLNGKMSQKEVEKFPFITASLVQAGALFNQPVAQEMMMARVLHYNKYRFDFPSPQYTGMSYNDEPRVDLPVAVAWGLLATLNGSETAGRILAEYALPKLDDTGIEYAKSLVIKFAKARLEILDGYHKEINRQHALAAEVVPVLPVLDFQRMSMSQLQSELVKVVNRLDQFRHAVARLHREASNDIYYSCGHEMRTVSGPEVLVRQIMAERWEKCSNVVQTIVTKYGAQLRQPRS